MSKDKDGNLDDLLDSLGDLDSLLAEIEQVAETQNLTAANAEPPPAVEQQPAPQPPVEDEATAEDDFSFDIEIDLESLTQELESQHPAPVMDASPPEESPPPKPADSTQTSELAVDESELGPVDIDPSLLIPLN